MNSIYYSNGNKIKKIDFTTEILANHSKFD